MNINENGFKQMVLFSELRPGDVFYRYGYDGGIKNHYLMKIRPIQVKTDDGEEHYITAIKLFDGGTSGIKDDMLVVPVRASMLVESGAGAGPPMTD